MSEQVHTFGVQVLYGHQFDAATRAATAGDVDAQRAMLAFLHWTRQVSASRQEPGCFTCGKAVHPANSPASNFGGFVYAHPTRGNEGKNVGWIGVFCSDCETKNMKTLADEFGDYLADNLGLEHISIQ